MSRRLLAATSVAVLLSTTGAAVHAQDSARRPGAPAAQTKPAADLVSQLEQTLAKNPDDPKVNVALGVAYLEGGDGARALEPSSEVVDDCGGQRAQLVIAETAEQVEIENLCVLALGHRREVTSVRFPPCLGEVGEGYGS